jgi:hypothetical protein
MHTVHIRVNDTAGMPTPVRLRLVDDCGVYRAPLGRLSEFVTAPGQDVGGNLQLGETRFAYIDGTCEAQLPAGPVAVEVHKGPEYEPMRRVVTLGPGQISLRLAVERWVDLRQEGWFAGDTRVLNLDPFAAGLEGAAEGLAVVNLLAYERPPAGETAAACPNLLAFSGKQAALPAQGCLVAVNTLNAHPVLGTVSLLNCHRVVYPLRFGAPGPDDWSVADWCDQCHRKRGMVVWPDLPRQHPGCPQGELLACALLGKVDAFEVSDVSDPEKGSLAAWYRLLGCGVRVSLVGGSGKDSNAVAVGAVRTYAHLEGGLQFGYGPWVEAASAGRTFVTAGPLVTLTADGQRPGAVITKQAGQRLRLMAEARSVTTFDHLEVLANGAVVAAANASGDRPSAVVEVELPVAESAWLAARCRAAAGVCAHTSAVYLEVPGLPQQPDAQMAQPLLAALEQTLAWIANSARCSHERHRVRLAKVVLAGHNDLLGRLKT